MTAQQTPPPGPSDAEARQADTAHLRARAAEIKKLGEQIEALAQTAPPK